MELSDVTLTRAETIRVAATPDAVWALVTDIGRTGEWSPVCTSCAWDEAADRDAGAEGPRVGDRFTGRNEHEGRVWETRSRVVAAEPGRSFAWEVGDGWVRWGYELASADGPGGGTDLTERWEFTPAGLEMFEKRYGADAEAQVRDRAAQAHAGIPATLAALKSLLEG